MRDLAAADALEAKPSRGCRPGQPGVPEAFAAPSWRAGLKTMSSGRNHSVPFLCISGQRNWCLVGQGFVLGCLQPRGE